MHTMQRLKTQNQWFFISAAQILSLLIVFGIGGCRGCGLRSENGTTIKLSMTLSTKTILNHEKVTVTIKNEAEKISEEEVANKVSSEKAKLMIKFVTGGTGSKFVYEDEDGKRVEESEITRPLDKFKGNNTIPAQKTKTFDIGVIPGPGITAADFEISLVVIKAGADVVVTTEKVTWNGKDLGLSLQLKIRGKDIKYEVIKKPGVAVEDINDKIEIVYEKAEASNAATLARTGAGTETIAGTILLEKVDFDTTPNQAVGTLTVDLKTEESVEVEFTLKYNGATLATKTEKVQKDIRLSIGDINYDRGVSNKITVKIKNDGIDEAKGVKLAYTTTSLATINGEKAAFKGNLDILANTDKEIDLGVLDFKSEKDTEFTFTLEYGATQVVQQTHSFIAKELQITLTPGAYDPEHGTIKVKIENVGTDKVESGDNLVLHYSLDKGAVIQGTLAASGSEKLDALAVKDEFTKTLTIDLKGEANSTLTLQLKLDGKALGVSKTVDCKEDVQLISSFVDTDLTGKADLKAVYAVKNEGKNAAEKRNLKVRVIRIKGSNATINDVKPGSTFGAATFVDATTGVGKSATENIVTLVLNPNGDKEEEIFVQLVYRDKAVGNIKKITWEKEAPKLVITDLVQAIKGAETTFKYKLQNTGADKAEQSKIGLRVANYSVGAVQVAGMVILPYTSVVLKHPKLGISGDLAKSAQTDELNLAIDPQANTKVYLDLQPVYDIIPQGVVQKVTWEEATPVFESKIEIVGAATSYKEQPAKITLINKSGRALRTNELKSLTLHYSGTATINYQYDNIEGKTLEALLRIVRPVAHFEVIEIPVTLSRLNNEKKTITKIELKVGSNSLMQGPFTQLDWESAPVFESKIGMIGAATNFMTQPAKITLINKSGRELTVEELKVLTLNYTAGSAGIGYNSGGKFDSINNKTLADLGKVAGAVANNAEIEIEVILFRKDNTSKVVTNVRVGTAQMQDNFQSLDWPASVLKFESKIEMVGAATDFAQQPAKITLTNKSGRDLTANELKVLILGYTAEDAEIAYSSGGKVAVIRDKTLADLGMAVGSVVQDGIIEIPVILVRKDSRQKKITSVALKAGDTFLVQDGFSPLDWGAAPIFASKIEMNGSARNFREQPAKITLINKSGRELTVDELKLLKLYYDGSATIWYVSLGNKPINIQKLSLEALGKATGPVVNDGVIEIEVTLLRKDNIDTQITSIRGNAAFLKSATILHWPASVLKFESKIEMNGLAMSFREQPAKITLINKSGRDLTAEELKVLKLNYTGTAKIGYFFNKEAKYIDEKTLLGAFGKVTGPVVKDGIIELPVTLVREQNANQQITSVALKAGDTFLMDGTFGKLDWEAVPKIMLTSDKPTGYDSGDSEMKLTVKPTVDISEDLAKKIKVKVTATAGGSLKLKGGADINGLFLFELLGGNGLKAAGGEVEVNIEFDVSSDKIFEIFLRGPIELMGGKVIVNKKV
jgi:hypothetical protein